MAQLIIGDKVKEGGREGVITAFRPQNMVDVLFNDLDYSIRRPYNNLSKITYKNNPAKETSDAVMRSNPSVSDFTSLDISLNKKEVTNLIKSWESTPVSPPLLPLIRTKRTKLYFWDKKNSLDSLKDFTISGVGAICTKKFQLVVFEDELGQKGHFIFSSLDPKYTMSAIKSIMDDVDSGKLVPFKLRRKVTLTVSPSQRTELSDKNKINKNPKKDDTYDPADEQKRAVINGVYKSLIKKHLGLKYDTDFVLPNGSRLDDRVDAETRRDIFSNACAIATRQGQKYGTIEVGSGRPTVKGLMKSQERYADESSLSTKRREYERTLARVRKSNYFRVTEELVGAEKRYYVHPRPTSDLVNIPEYRLTREKAEADAQLAEAALKRLDVQSPTRLKQNPYYYVGYPQWLKVNIPDKHKEVTIRKGMTFEKLAEALGVTPDDLLRFGSFNDIPAQNFSYITGKNVAAIDANAKIPSKYEGVTVYSDLDNDTSNAVEITKGMKFSELTGKLGVDLKTLVKSGSFTYPAKPASMLISSELTALYEKSGTKRYDMHCERGSLSDPTAVIPSRYEGVTVYAQDMVDRLDGFADEDELFLADDQRTGYVKSPTYHKFPSADSRDNALAAAKEQRKLHESSAVKEATEKERELNRLKEKARAEGVSNLSPEEKFLLAGEHLDKSQIVFSDPIAASKGVGPDFMISEIKSPSKIFKAKDVFVYNARYTEAMDWVRSAILDILSSWTPSNSEIHSASTITAERSTKRSKSLYLDAWRVYYAYGKNPDLSHLERDVEHTSSNRKGKRPGDFDKDFYEAIFLETIAPRLAHDVNSLLADPKLVAQVKKIEANLKVIAAEKPNQIAYKYVIDNYNKKAKAWLKDVTALNNLIKEKDLNFPLAFGGSDFYRVDPTVIPSSIKEGKRDAASGAGGGGGGQRIDKIKDYVSDRELQQQKEAVAERHAKLLAETNRAAESTTARLQAQQAIAARNAIIASSNLPFWDVEYYIMVKKITNEEEGKSYELPVQVPADVVTVSFSKVEREITKAGFIFPDDKDIPSKMGVRYVLYIPQRTLFINKADTRGGTAETLPMEAFTGGRAVKGRAQMGLRADQQPILAEGKKRPRSNMPPAYSVTTSIRIPASYRLIKYFTVDESGLKNVDNLDLFDNDKREEAETRLNKDYGTDLTGIESELERPEVKQIDMLFAKSGLSKKKRESTEKDKKNKLWKRVRPENNWVRYGSKMKQLKEREERDRDPITNAPLKAGARFERYHVYYTFDANLAALTVLFYNTPDLLPRELLGVKTLISGEDVIKGMVGRSMANASDRAQAYAAQKEYMKKYGIKTKSVSNESVPNVLSVTKSQINAIKDLINENRRAMRPIQSKQEVRGVPVDIPIDQLQDDNFYGLLADYQYTQLERSLKEKNIQAKGTLEEPPEHMPLTQRSIESSVQKQSPTPLIIADDSDDLDII